MKTLLTPSLLIAMLFIAATAIMPNQSLQMVRAGSDAFQELFGRSQAVALFNEMFAERETVIKEGFTELDTRLTKLESVPAVVASNSGTADCEASLNALKQEFSLLKVELLKSGFKSPTASYLPKATYSTKSSGSTGSVTYSQNAVTYSQPTVTYTQSTPLYMPIDSTDCTLTPRYSTASNGSTGSVTYSPNAVTYSQPQYTVSAASSAGRQTVFPRLQSANTARVARVQAGQTAGNAVRSGQCYRDASGQIHCQ